MSDTHHDDEQARLWNGRAGRGWVEAQEVLDQMFKPLETLLADAISAKSPRQVLDVGCGTGATTLAAARLLGARGRAIGIDISAPMIAVARLRAERERIPAQFICADAQAYAFEPASADMIISRFGVMFFSDPVRAFAQLRRAATDDAHVRFIVWRRATENPFMTTAECAAAPLLPDIPARVPGAPGQFAFANADRVRSILEESGWAEIDIQPLDVDCTLPESELGRYITRLGPVGSILQEADDLTRTKVSETVRPAFEPYVHGSEVRFTAACWMVSAQAQAASRAQGTTT
jgi:SAM-dependent methyltransferase